MKHICVIGNSHVGALKAGFKSWKEPSYQASFFSIPGGGGPALGTEEGVLTIPERSVPRIVTDIEPSPQQRFDISRFDAIMLSGLGMPAIRVQNKTLHRFYVAAGFIDKPDLLGDRQIISKNLFKALVEEELQSKESFKNIARISSIFQKNIYIQLFPLPSPDIINRDDFDLQCYGEKLGEFLSWYYQIQIDTIKKYTENKNVFIVDYPKEWMQAGFIPLQYETGNDTWHKTKEFGRYFMEELLGSKLC